MVIIIIVDVVLASNMQEKTFFLSLSKHFFRQSNYVIIDNYFKNAV